MGSWLIAPGMPLRAFGGVLHCLYFFCGDYDEIQSHMSPGYPFKISIAIVDPYIIIIPISWAQRGTPICVHSLP